MPKLSLISLFCQADKYKRLVQAKLYSFAILEHYAASDKEDYQKYAERILNCSCDLKVRVSDEITPNGIETKTSIENARWCRVRHCSLCQFARVSKQRAILFKAFSKLDLTNQSFIFLTLTVRNRPLNELRQTLDEMTKAWNKFNRRRTFPVQGFLRSMEVTMQRELVGKKNTGQPVRSSSGQLMVHPHFHCLLQMKDGYFTEDFKSKDWWIDEWQSALKVDYRPSVAVRKVKPTSDSDFAKALLETIKYTVKPSEFGYFFEAPELLYGFTEQLHRLRSLSIGGIFSKLCSQADLDKIEDSCTTEEEKSQVGDLLRLVWNDSRNVYDVEECND